MKTINQLADELILKFIGNDHLDFRTEISNDDIMFNKDTFKIVDDYGQDNFENLVINKLDLIHKKEQQQ